MSRHRAIAIALAVALLASVPLVARAAAVPVGPGAMDGWDILNRDGWTGTEVTGPTTAGSKSEFVTGPATPPSGTGSLRQVIGDASMDNSRLRTRLLNGTALTAIDSLTYWTYVKRNTDDAQASAISLLVDLDGDGSYAATTDDVLVFEPVYQDGSYSGDVVPNQCEGRARCIVKDTWQKWNAATGGWWSARAGNSGPPLVTLDNFAAANPGAALVANVATPALRIAAGSGGSWKNFEGFADALSVNGTLYDFETVPLAPVITGPSNGRTFATTQVQILGTATAGDTVKVFRGTTLLATATAAGAMWSTPILTFTEGSHTVHATSTRDGVTSPPSTAVRFTVDLTPPAAPVITDPAKDSWNQAKVTVRGTAEPGATVEVRESNFLLAATTAGADGRWALTNLPFTDGTHSILATARDAAGNTSKPSAAHRFFVDAFGPRLEITHPSDGSFYGPETPVELRGTATDNQVVVSVTLTYYDLAGRVAGASTPECTGCGTAASVTWTDKPSLPLPGYYTVRVAATDRVLNPAEPVTRTFLKIP